MSDAADAPGNGPNGPPVEGARVLLLVAHDENRRLLGDWLAGSHEVVAPAESDPDTCDLCIVDGRALKEREEWLREQRAAVSPTLLPVLLVVSEDSQLRWYREPRVRRIVDELIAAPVRKDELRARIQGLLERRELSVERTRKETQFRTLFQLAPDPVVVLDEEGYVRRANDAFRRVATAETTDPTGHRLDALSGFPEAVVESLVVGSGGASGVPGDPVTATYTTADGETRIAEIASAVLRDAPDDGARGTINVLRDVTERTESRRELERQTERLAEFARILAHELRNPLTIATGYLDSLEVPAGQASEDAETIALALGRIDRLIDELLRLARQGEVVGEFEPVTIGRIADSAWAAVPSSGASLRVDAADAVVIADRDRLADLFENLFANAVTHGGDDVAVRVGEVVDGFYVEDDGPGIPEEARDRLFEAGATPAEDGTGFGLAIVRQIAEAHGWELAVTDGSMGGARIEVRGMESPTDER